LAIRRQYAKVNIRLAKPGEQIKRLNEITWWRFGYLIMIIILWKHGDAQCDWGKDKPIIEIIISSVRPFQLMMGKSLEH
jgi:hypothetical protein